MDTTNGRDRRGLGRLRHWLYAGAGVALATLAGLYAARPPEVQVATLQAQRAERVLAITGRTRPQVTVTILPRVAGQVAALSKEEGDVVAKGDLLVRLEAEAPTAALEQSANAVAAQRRVVLQAEREFDRAQSLNARGLITLKAFEDARFALDQALVELARTQAARREIATRLDDTRIVAPVSGVVLARHVDVGQVVSTQSVIYEIAPLRDVEVETEIDERFLAEIHEGMKAQIAVPGVEAPIGATLHYISPKIDPRIGGAKVRFRFDQAPEELRAGVTVDINLSVETREHALAVARQQILGRDVTAAVLVLNGGRVERRAVEFLDWPSPRVIVTAGLRPGEQLLVSPRPNLIGKRVQGVELGDAMRAAATREGSRAL